MPIIVEAAVLAQPYNPPDPRKINALITELSKVDLSAPMMDPAYADFEDFTDDPNDPNYNPDYEIENQSVKEERMVEQAVVRALGPDIGGTADWSVPAWHLGSGRTNRTDGDLYLLQDESDPIEWIVVAQRIDEVDGVTDPEDVATLHGLKGLLGWAKAQR